MADINKKIVFGIGVSTGDPTIVLLIPRAAFEHMLATGEANDLDLRKIGLPIKIAVGSVENHAAGVSLLQKAAAEGGITINDMRKHDFKIDDVPRRDDD